MCSKRPAAASSDAAAGLELHILTLVFLAWFVVAAAIACGLSGVGGVPGRHCYQCDKVASPQDCDNIGMCAEDEVCFTERFLELNLREYYRMGCRAPDVCRQSTLDMFGFGSNIGIIGKRDGGSHDNSTRTDTDQEVPRTSRAQRDEYPLCFQCCDGEYCNNNLCGSAPSSQLRCFECRDVDSPHDCDKVTECGPHYKCYVRYGPSHASHRYIYNMGCMAQIQCSAAASSYQMHGCFACCDDRDYCSVNACGAVATTTTTTTTTTAATTTHLPATTTTSKLPLSLVPGPVAYAQYMGHISATCSSKPGITIGWGFNNTNSLPTGARTDGHGTLTIDKLTSQNAGVYKCIAVSSTGHIASKVIQVKIVEVPATALYIERQPVGLISAGARFSLRCHVIGYPVPTVTWSLSDTHGGHVIPSAVRYSDNDQLLTVDHYSHALHDGDWSCTATNKLGHSTSHVTLP